MATAQARYKLMLKTEIAPALRVIGMRGSGTSYYLPHPTSYLLLGFQSSTSSTSELVKFTVNLAAIDKHEWEERHQPWWGKVTANTRAPIGCYERLGAVMPAGDDIWWRVAQSAETSSVADEVCSVIRDFALPALHRDLR